MVTTAIERLSGAPVHINKFSLGIFKPSVRLRGFKMYNPSGFAKGVLVDLPRADVEYDVSALLKGKLHLLKVEIELSEIGVMRNIEKKLNVDCLKVSQKQGESSSDIVMQIDTLKLHIGRIVYKDYSLSQEPFVQVYEIKFQKTYKDITSPRQLALLVLTEPMKAAGIRGAAVYGASVLASAAVLPAAVATVLTGRDNAQANFALPFEKVYAVGVEVVKRIGRIKSEDESQGLIRAEVNSAIITLKCKRLVNKTTQVIVSARKYLLPKPEMAAGVLYQISEKLK
jgi:hypothetical protein